MSRFIKTSSGYLNQDHILLIRFGVEKEEGEDLIQMSDGRVVQTQIQDFDWLAQNMPGEEQNRRRTMGAAISAEEQNRRRTMGAAPVAGEQNRRRTMGEPAAPAAPEPSAAPEAETSGAGIG